MSSIASDYGSMSDTPSLPIDRTLPPEERVVQAALCYLKAYSRIPTQDQVVQVLAQGDGKSTGKATVNKYWGSFQHQLAHDLSLTSWLPSEIPDFVSEHLIALVDWARRSADEELSVRHSQLDEREETLNRLSESYKQRIETLTDTNASQQKKLDEQDKSITTLNSTVSSLKQALSDSEKSHAVTSEKLTNADLALARVTDEQSSTEIKVKELQTLVEKLRLDNQQLTSQHHSLQRQHDKLLLTHSNLVDEHEDKQQRIHKLHEQLASSEDSLATTKNLLAKFRTTSETQQSKLELLGSLQDSVTALKQSLDVANQRNVLIEEENNKLKNSISEITAVPLTQR